MSFFSALKRGFHNFGNLIAILANTVLLLVVYLLGVGVVSLIAKISGKKFLEKVPRKRVKSYWVKLDDDERYYRQY